MKNKANQTILRMKQMGQPFEWEELYKVWHIMSWVFLIFGYALTIVNGVLFVDNPQLLFGLGILMISISVPNIVFMIINLIFLLVLIVKEEGWYYYREYFWVTVLYIAVSAVLTQAAII